MFACSERRFGELAMVRCRQANVDRVHLRIADRRVQVIGKLGADGRRDSRGPRAPPRRERLHAHAIARAR